MNHDRELVLITDPIEEAILRESDGGPGLPRAFTDGWNVYVDGEELAAWRIARKNEALEKSKKKSDHKPLRSRWIATKVLK